VPHEPLRVGGAEVVALCDARVPLALEEEFPGAHPGGWEPVRDGYPWAFAGIHAWDLHVHAYVVRTPGALVLIDTGIGGGAPEGWGPVEGSLASELALVDVAPSEVDHVVFTHLHLDHVGGATTTEGEPRFPYATYHAHPADWEAFREAEDRQDHAAFDRSVRPVADRDRLAVRSEDHEVVPGVRLLHAPGHTPGHRAVVVGSGDRELWILGDALHHPFQVAAPDWLSSHDVDPALGSRTRRRLLRTLADRGCPASVAHFGRPFGRVEGEDPSRWIAEP
jgi:glyoxylase-like metal-dependent hydrolase (beta-lactamase superfamily II)